MRAAKESGKNLIHVIKVSKSDSRSVLKFSARNTSCGDCAECRSKSFETLPDLKRHFEGRHHCVVTIKSLTSEPKATAAVQSSERGQFWNSSFVRLRTRFPVEVVFAFLFLSDTSCFGFIKFFATIYLTQPANSHRTIFVQSSTYKVIKYDYVSADDVTTAICILSALAMIQVVEDR